MKKTVTKILRHNALSEGHKTGAVLSSRQHYRKMKGEQKAFIKNKIEPKFKVSKRQSRLLVKKSLLNITQHEKESS